MVHLERLYSHVKEWQRKFFFVFGDGGEFPSSKTSRCEYRVRVAWGLVPNNRDFLSSFLAKKRPFCI